MVVALDLEDDGITIADVDDASILARTANHPRPRRRQCLEPDLRRFVGAVLAPHHREYAQFGDVRGAAEERDGALEFFPAQPVLGGQFGCGVAAADHEKPPRYFAAISAARFEFLSSEVEKQKRLGKTPLATDPLGFPREEPGSIVPTARASDRR